jgi:hypothetical protein
VDCFGRPYHQLKWNFSGTLIRLLRYHAAALSWKFDPTILHRAAKLGMNLEWTDDGVKTVMGPTPAVRRDERDPGQEDEIWFNSMVAAYTGWEDACEGRDLRRRLARPCPPT